MVCVCVVCGGGGEQTPMRPTQRKGGASAMARKILRERNTSTSTTSSMNPEETFLSHANMSLASTGTYTDFQVITL